MSPEKPQAVTVDGHRIKLSNLDKVLYPATGTTKGEVLDYLARIAPALITHARHRPATRKRWPDGVGGPVFFQKNSDASTPSWVRTHRIRHSSSTDDYVLVDDLATLTWLGPLTLVCAQTSFFAACSGVTQGPPAFQPLHKFTPNAIPHLSASRTACL